MKTVHVAAAIILNDGKVLAAQRGYGEFKDGWEFPGGKLEPGESGTEACTREIREELSATIAVDRFLCTIEHQYESFHLTMDCYLCHVVDGEIAIEEHEAMKWLTAESLMSVAWLPADLKILPFIKEALGW